MSVDHVSELMRGQRIGQHSRDRFSCLALEFSFYAHFNPSAASSGSTPRGSAVVRFERTLEHPFVSAY